jgi:hypothetical protein
MTDHHGASVPPSPSPVPPPPRRSRHPLLTVAMVLIGLILLLPGLCAIVFTGAIGSGGSALVALWLVCILISGGGVLLVVKAFR